jgi:hypothetical protein
VETGNYQFPLFFPPPIERNLEMNPEDIGFLKVTLALLEFDDEWMAPDQRRTNAIAMVRDEIKHLEKKLANNVQETK